jgi:glycosyltransferase involved in cell wall biosynthesis
VTAARVALVVPSAARRGGGDIWLAHLLETLTPDQVDLLVVFETDGELVELTSAVGHRVAVLGRTDTACDVDLTTLAEPLARVLTREELQVTVHWSPRAHVYGTRARQMIGRNGPVAWVQHVIPSDFWLHRLANACPAQAVVCVSHAVAQAHHGLYSDRPAAVLHPGVGGSLALFGKAEARANLKVPREALLIGVVGRVEPWKGQDVTVRAVHLLREKGLPAHALLIGETRSPTWPAFADEVTTLIAELGLGQHVSFTGHLATPTAALASLDVLVCSSRQEGFSLAVAEGMAAGVPVVATRCGGPEDLIDDGVNGLLVPVEDSAALADAVARLAVDPTLAVELAAAGRATWTGRFTARHGAERFLGLVQELVCGS